MTENNKYEDRKLNMCFTARAGGGEVSANTFTWHIPQYHHCWINISLQCTQHIRRFGDDVLLKFPHHITLQSDSRQF